MSEAYTLFELHERTCIGLEKLRYAVDQKLLPGLRHGGRGTPRVYTEYEAFAIACAAYLIAAGLRRASVQKIMDLLCGMTGVGQAPLREHALYRAFTKNVQQVEVGDHVGVRALGQDRRSSEWRHVESGGHLNDFEPTISVVINTVKLRKCLKR